MCPARTGDSVRPGYQYEEGPHTSPGGFSQMSQAQGQSFLLVCVSRSPSGPLRCQPRCDGWLQSVPIYQRPTVNGGITPEPVMPGLCPCCPSVSLPGESIETVRFPGIRKSHAQTGHQRRVENYSCTLVPGGQVNGGDGPNALTVQNDVLRTHTIPAEIRGCRPLANEQQERTKPTLP